MNKAKKYSKVIHMKQRWVKNFLRYGVLLRFDQTLGELLQHITDVARYLIGAKYSALTVLDDNGNIVHFVHSGLKKNVAKSIGDPPKGHGVLGIIIESNKPLRLKDITKHPKFYGFPPHHPKMKSFLGVPIVVNGKPYGRLYLTEKLGHSSFNKRDEKLAMLLSSQASIAVERAILSEQAMQTERLRLLNEILNNLNRLTNEKAILESALKGIKKALPFSEASICLYHPEDDTFSGCVAIPEGKLSQLHQKWKGRPIKSDRTPFGACLEQRSLVRVDRLEKPKTPLERWLTRQGFKSFTATPIVLDDEVLGILFTPSELSSAFSDNDLNFLKAVAEYVATTLKNTRLLKALQGRERIRGLLLNKIVTAQEEERKRIAHELHDQIGQLLTALLIQLQLLERTLNDPKMRKRTKLLKEITEEISSQLHNMVWELRPPSLDELGLSDAIERLVSEWSDRFNISCSFETDGIQEISIPPEVTIGVFRIVQEALTNIAKHSKAKCAKVSLKKSDSNLTATIEDNGIGFNLNFALKQSNENKRLGLLGMMERASMLSGQLIIESKQGKGTKIIANFPVQQSISSLTSSTSHS